MFGILSRTFSFVFVTKHLSLIFSPDNTSKYSLRLITIELWSLTFKLCCFLITRHITCFFLGSVLTGKSMYPKLIDFSAYGVALSSSKENAPNWSKCILRISVLRYWIFAPAFSVLDASKIMLRLEQKNNSSGLLLTSSSPRCPLWSHYLVHSENNSYFIGIRPIRDVELTCKFRPGFPLCTQYRR